MNRPLIALCVAWTGLVACSDSNRSAVTPAPTPPTAPPPAPAPATTTLNAVVTGPTTVELTWTDNVSTETGFRIERASSPFVALSETGVDSSSFTDDTAQPSETYSYRVIPFNASGDLDASNTVMVTTPPLIDCTSISPNSGFTTGGTAVTIGGAGFSTFGAGGAAVQIGGSAAGSVAVVDDTSLTCSTPTAAAGPANVTVSNGIGNGSSTLNNGFTYFTYPPVFLDVDVRVDRDLAGAADSECPRIRVEGSNIYVAWGDFRGGLAQDIYFNASSDGGRTWLAADRRLDTDASGRATSACPELSSSGTNVYAVWADYRNGGSDIYFNGSSDGGATWFTSDLRLDTDLPGAGSSTEPRIASDGSNVYVVWQEGRNGKKDIYFNGSSDGGLTWLAQDVRLDTDLPGRGFSLDPQLSASGSNVHVAWMDIRNGRGDIFFNGSTDGGATWLSSDVQLDTDGKGVKASVQPRIASDGSNVTVVWQDLRNGREDLYSNSSSDNGATWLAVDVRIDTDTAGRASSKNQRLLRSGNAVHVVWQDGRHAGSDIYLNSSSDGGATWASADQRLNTNPAGSAYAIDPRICGNRGLVYAVWVDARGGNRDIYFNSSTDDGASWLAKDIRIDADLSGIAEATVPDVASDGASVYAVWADTRNGIGSDIFFTRNKVQ